MARKGKGKPMAEQAKGLLKKYIDYSSRHAAKQEAGIKGSKTTGKIHAIGTFNKYASSLKLAGEWVKVAYQQKHLDSLTKDQAQAYLEQRVAHGIGQKQLDADRTALRFLLQQELDKVKALEPQELKPRAYTNQQIDMVRERQKPHNTIATDLVRHGGLRAHELHTIRRLDEGQAAPHRTWHTDRFMGRQGVRYIVIGKGGLSREIMIPYPLAERLETWRIDQRPVTDRQIHYEGKRYSIGGGQAWSESFSRASSAELRWSKGGHGLRHSYAQDRYIELMCHGCIEGHALRIIGQEMGHFRDDVTKTYFR